MHDPLSRREFSRRAAIAGLAAGMSPMSRFDDVTSESVRVDDDSRLAAAEFQHVRDGIYLNHAASSPLPQRASDAVRGYLADRQRLFHLYQTGTQDYSLPVLQSKVGKLLGASAELIGFEPTTTEALAGALNGIDWKPGDNVVVPANEFPGVLYPCLHLARRGVEVRQVAVDQHVDLAKVVQAIDARTRAVAISWVHWLTGHRIDLDALGRACRASNALSLVDAIQGVGAVPIDVSAAQLDFVVTGSYKWLMAIPGTAAIYTSPRFLAQVTPDRAGHAGMKTSVYTTPKIDWLDGAARFHVGGTINPALIALEHSVDLAHEVGVGRIQEHASTLIDALARGATRAGLKLNSDVSPAHRSSFVNLTTGDAARDDRVVKGLVAQKIIVGRRGPGIRVAPHLHNNLADIDAFLAAAKSIA